MQDIDVLGGSPLGSAWRLVSPPPKVVQGLVPDDQVLPGIFSQSVLQRGFLGLEIIP